MKRLLVVDDEASHRMMVQAVTQDEGWLVEEAGSGEEALTILEDSRPTVVLLDMRMPGMDGQETLDRILDLHPGLPVVMLTAHGTVDSAVEAMKKGAFDFFEKPLNDNELATRVAEAIVLDTRQRENIASLDSVNQRLASLTSREKQIMELVLAGKLNKVIADELNISMRTVEVHRANLFDKMKVKTAVDLANLINPVR